MQEVNLENVRTKAKKMYEQKQLISMSQVHNL